MNKTTTDLPIYRSDEQKSLDRLRRTVILNDFLRRYFVGGKVVVSSWVECLDEETFSEVIREVQDFKDFSEDNDPYGEHDFGSVTVRGKRYFWKIDYYDKDMNGHSEDKSNPVVTERVLTIMRAEEY
jgi:hypothetical protein